MKPTLVILSLILHIIPCSPRATAAEPPKVAPVFDGNLVIHAIIVSVPKATAVELLAKPDLKGNAKESLDAIHKLVAAGKASYVAIPSLKVMSGNMASSKSFTEFTVEAVVGPDNVTADMHLQVHYAGGEVKTKLTTKRGGTYLVGSTDPKPDEAAPEQQPSTHLIFIRVQ